MIAEYILPIAALACFMAGTIGLPVTPSMVLDLFNRLSPEAQAYVKERINGKTQ
jgi:hypothetical protein